MDALSSSPNVSTIQPLKLHFPHIKTMPKSTIKAPPSFPSSPCTPILIVSSVRNEEKPQTSTTRPEEIISTATKSSTKKSSTTGAVIKRRVLKTTPNLLTVMFNALDNFINNYIDYPIRPSVDPKFVLCDNFAPVDELPPTECEVIEGSIPSCLDGAYIRNGPNPQYLPRGPYHLFDGDGMLHCIKISHGKNPIFCSRYVKTYKYTIEHEAGAPIFPNLFSASAARLALFIAQTLAGQFNPANGLGLANTSLAIFGNGLYALGESDLPYALRLTSNGDIETLGRHDFDGELLMSMTSHPKISVEMGEVFAFRYGPIPPFLTYFRFDANGHKHPDVPIFSIGRPSFFHDFAITDKYAIFADIQIGMNPNPIDVIFRGGSFMGFDPAKIPRLGIIPRYAKDELEMKWFDMPGFNPVHIINAWDEEDAIVLLAPNKLSLQHGLDRLDLIHGMVEKVRIDLKNGTVTRNPVSIRNLDFVVVNPAYVGKKNRFVYAGMGDPLPKISEVVKLDLSTVGGQESTVASRMYGPKCYGGEPFFVAEKPDNPEAKEDDGYLVSYVHDEIAGESKFLVMDAKSPDLDVVAVVKLPQRVPYGFHGLFVRESDFKKLL